MSMPKVSLDGTSDFEIPRHVAIIMDGNGRWAAARGLPRGEGHRRGVEALRRTVRAAGELGIDILTIFAFSSENWSRPQTEIRDLLGLLRRFIRNDLAELHQNNIRVRIIGEREGLAPDVESASNKLFASEMVQRLAQTAQEILGLHGQLEPGQAQAPLGGYYEKNYMTRIPDTIAEGTSEIQRTIIATRGLGLPRG